MNENTALIETTPIELAPLDLATILPTAASNIYARLAENSEHLEALQNMQDPILAMHVRLRQEKLTSTDPISAYAFKEYEGPFDFDPAPIEMHHSSFARNAAITAGICLGAPAFAYGITKAILKIKAYTAARNAKKLEAQQQLALSEEETAGE